MSDHGSRRRRVLDQLGDGIPRALGGGRDPHERPGRLRRDDRERRRLARAGTADHQQPAIGDPHAHRPLPLPLRFVGETQHERAVRHPVEQSSSSSTLVGSAGSQGRRGGGPSDREITLSTSSGLDRAIAHAMRRRVARASEEREAPALGAAREQRRLIGPDHRAAVDGVRHAQADPQRAVREQAVADHTGRALRAEDEVHAEGAAAGRDIREDGMQLGMVAQQRRELVDDDHESRQVDPRIEDVAGPRAGDGGLAQPDLGAQALDRASRAGAVQIRDDARDVRHARERVERRPALEVGEQEAHLAGGVRRAQREDPGDEQLALARAGDSRDDRVRAVRDEVDERRLTASDADHRGKGADAGAAARRASTSASATARSGVDREAQRPLRARGELLGDLERLLPADGLDVDRRDLAGMVERRRAERARR